MFYGISKVVTPGLTRQERRLLTVADATRTKSGLSQRYTFKEATRQLARFDLTRRRHRCRPDRTSEAEFQPQSFVTTAASSCASMPKSSWKPQENIRTQSSTPYYTRDVHNKKSHSKFTTRTFGTNVSTISRQTYDNIDKQIGDSLIQIKFNKLVHSALLRYGPPLPTEFVVDNDVVSTSSGSPMSVRRHGHMSTMDTDGSDRCFECSFDLGADSANYLMYDEVGLKPHELMRIIRLHHPFSIHDDCDGVPFSVLVKNCPYLQAYGGKIHYMRYLRRKRHNSSVSSDGRAGENDDTSLLVSIAKYKMREVPSQDGVRQGPQPWLYPYELK